MITEGQVQESVDFLFSSAGGAAQARANRAVLEQGLKRVKALEMQRARNEHERLTNSKAPYAVTLQERDAYASPAYKTALDGLGEAIVADERLRALRDAHSARIDAWRTQQATMRSVKL
jgi:uncharacterized caspase-like protein